jgi:pilus assembly protein TadC
MSTIVFLVVLFILSIILAFIAGRYSMREEIKEAEKNDPTNFYQTIQTPGVTPGDLEELAERVVAVDRQVQALREEKQNAPSNISMGADRRLEMIEPLVARVKELEERDRAYQDRFKRVERKAGMSV